MASSSHPIPITSHPSSDSPSQAVPAPGRADMDPFNLAESNSGPASGSNSRTPTTTRPPTKSHPSFQSRSRGVRGSRSPSTSPEPVSPSLLPLDKGATRPDVEVSMVEASDVTGVSFKPELWMQRRAWALEVLKTEQVRSVLDLGCGPGALLESLVIPPPTIREPPILPSAADRQALKELGEEVDDTAHSDVYIDRLGALDNNPALLPAALATLSPGSAPQPTAASASNWPTPALPSDPAASQAQHGTGSPPPPALGPRWQPMTAELWLGNIERYNSRLEGYEAIVALELVEHLDQAVLDRFGVVCLGTYRPRVLLVSTPNFDFNAKFPRGHEHEWDFARKGFMDPTGRTERVFRHSDHKLEWTFSEFTSWATAAAADWGYTVSVSGVGVSSSPSYYPDGTPIYATSTACFRLQAAPMRSPRSVRSTQLPFMPGSREDSHPHKLAGRFHYPVSATGPTSGADLQGSASAPSHSHSHSHSHPSSSSTSKTGRSNHHNHHHGESAHPHQSPGEIRRLVRSQMEQWGLAEASVSELWGGHGPDGAAAQLALACGGSKRRLVAALGGYGDVAAAFGDDAAVAVAGQSQDQEQEGEGEFEVRWLKGWGLAVCRRGAEGEGMDVDGAEGEGNAGGFGKRGTKRAAGREPQSLEMGGVGARETGGW